MINPPPAETGMPLEEVETPALIIELDAFEKNLERMAAMVAAAKVRLRPHSKTHKCPAIARRQIALGAVGACCQKVGEAEALVEGGINNVLVSVRTTRIVERGIENILRHCGARHNHFSNDT